MASFTDNPEDFQRLDFAILQNGSVSLYFRSSILEEDVYWLKAHAHRVDSFDCESWTDDAALLNDFGLKMEFPDYYGQNFNALSDCLGDIEIADDGGRPIVLNRFDSFASKDSESAQILLNILDEKSRAHLMFGRRLMTLVQSNDPTTRFETIGRYRANWNRREFRRVSDD
jgi:RNAse (barnase) inhibitor barstar